jgi:hypothetical protein
MKNKMKQLLFTFTLISSFTLFGQVPNLDWAVQFGGSSQVQGYSIDVDNNGNVYSSGKFGGTVDFDPGVGVANLTAGQYTNYISKLDANGGFIWAKMIIQGTSLNYTALTVDQAENVYVTGNFSGTVDFDPGAGVSNLTSVLSSDQFILKLDQNGDFIWAKRIAANNTDAGSSIKIDDLGNILLTGSFYGTVDFDPGVGTSNITVGGTSCFILKLDNNGDYIWAKHVTGTNPVAGYSIALDNLGNVSLTGYFNGTADFDPGPGIVNHSSNGSRDIFVLKLDITGNYLWSGSIGGSGQDDGWCIAADQSGNNFITGHFNGTVDFDPGAGVSNLTGASSEVFVLKLDVNGLLIWAKNIGGGISNNGISIDVDNLGNAYTTGYLNGTADFDPGLGVSNLTASGTHDIFLSKLNSMGDYVWAYNFGGTSADQGWAVTVDDQGAIYSTGYFQETADFDPGVAIVDLVSVSLRDAFIQKLSQCLPTTNSITEISCDSYTAPDGQIYISTGIYTAAITNTAGCDSIITIDLTINTIDPAAIQTDAVTLQANNSTGTYQWVDCDDDFSFLSGQTNQVFTATSNGNFAVIVTENGCSDTSSCFIIDEVGIDELFYQSKELLKIVDLMGRDTLPVKNTPLIYIYSDGSVERRFVLE